MLFRSSSWRRSSLCGGDDPGNCCQHGAFYAGRVCSGQGRHCTGSPFHCGVPAAVGAACPLPPEKGQSTIAHWDDPALCRTGDPVLGNIRRSIARCLRGILLLMTASEKMRREVPNKPFRRIFAAKNRAQKKFRARFDRSLN